MTRDDRNRADARSTRPAAPKTGKADHDVASRAVLDNMARLKALRLAREAAEPPRLAAAKKPRAKSRAKSDAKTPDLSEWLAGQQSGGRRT